MKLLAAMFVLTTHIAALPQLGPVVPAPPWQSQKVPEHRRKVPTLAKPKAILPAQKDLVSTAQSGASRSTKPATTMPALNHAEQETATATASASADPQKGHWVLLYRTANCIPCDRLMNSLSSNEGSGVPAAQGLTIVIGQPKAATTSHTGHQATAKPQAAKGNQTVAPTAVQQGELNTLRSKYPALNNAAWKYDSAGTASASLKPAGAPMMYGMDGSRIVWQTAGMPGGPTATQQRIASWLSSKSTAESVAATSAAAVSAHP